VYEYKGRLSMRQTADVDVPDPFRLWYNAIGDAFGRC